MRKCRPGVTEKGREKGRGGLYERERVTSHLLIEGFNGNINRVFAILLARAPVCFWRKTRRVTERVRLASGGEGGGIELDRQSARICRGGVSVVHSIIVCVSGACAITLGVAAAVS